MSLGTTGSFPNYFTDSGPPALNYSPSTIATGGMYLDSSTKDLYYCMDGSSQSNLIWGRIYTGQNALATVASTGAYSDLTGKPSLATVATTGAYSDLSGKPSLATVATSGSYTDLSNKPTIPSAQIQSDWTQTNSGSVDFIKNKPVTTFSTPTFNSSTTATQLSTTRDAQVIYTYPISLTTLLTSQSLTATLRYADNVGMSTNVVTVCDDVVGASGILNLALTGKLQVQGRIPAGKYRQVTFGQTGGATVPTTISSGQEVLF